MSCSFAESFNGRRRRLRVFQSDDKLMLDAQDAEFVSKRLVHNAPLSALKITVFWIVIVIVIAALLIYLSTPTTHG